MTFDEAIPEISPTPGPATPLRKTSSLSLKLAVAIAALVIFTVFITWRARVLEATLQRERDEPALIGQQAPGFSAASLDGRSVSLADFHGQKNVVVSFWASWCGPCRIEMPALIEFYKNNHTVSSDFELLAVSIDEDAKDASDFATAQKLVFPVLLDPHQRVANAFEVEGIPSMFIIDKNGKVIYAHSGYDMAMEFQLKRELGLEITPGSASKNKKNAEDSTE
jgi:peroxiredoxin